jgi:cold shock CspA family protein
LNEGQKVEFDVEPDPKQPRRNRASHVRLGA